MHVVTKFVGAKIPTKAYPLLSKNLFEFVFKILFEFVEIDKMRFLSTTTVCTNIL